MLITLRTVSGGSPINKEVQPTDTVKSVKDSLGGEYDLTSLKLCYKGKILDEDKTFGDLQFVGGEALIIAGRKLANSAPKPVAPAVVTTPTPAAKPDQPPVVAPVHAPAPAPAPATAPAPTPVAPTPAPTTSTARAPVDYTHGVDGSLIDSIVGMGFEDRSQVALALRAAYMNADRAVEYLCTGIPPAALAQIQQQAQMQHAAAHAHSSPSASASQSGGVSQEQLSAALGQTTAASTPLRQALSQIAQFEQIRAVVRQNPSALPTVMTELRQRHPEIFQLVQQNPQEFLAIMNETAPAETAPAGGAGAVRQLQITEADREPIQRLVAIGGGMWDERAATIVFLVCNRNEDMAANVLFDNGGLPAELAAAVMEGGLPTEGDYVDDEDEGEEQ